MKKFITLLLFSCLLISCNYFCPNVVEEEKAIIRGNNYILSSSTIHRNEYMLDITYLNRKTADGEKMGRSIYSNNKNTFSDFKRGDTVQVYKEYLTRKEFIVDKHNKKHYFTENVYILK